MSTTPETIVATQSGQNPINGSDDSEPRRIARFRIAYDGEDHADHRIDMKVLSVSLSALAEVLYEGAQVATGNSSSIDVQVSADFEAGSFGVDVEVIQHAIDTFPWLAALGFIGGAAISGTVLGILRTLKGREIELVEHGDSDTSVLLVDGKKTECPELVAKFVTNRNIRLALEKVVSDPLSRSGTSTFKVSERTNENNTIEVFSVEEDELESFQRLRASTTKKTQDEEISVKFVAADIEKNAGWKIEHDDRVMPVQMKDKQFVQRLQNMEEPHLFGKPFRVRLRNVRKTKLGVESLSRQIVTVRTDVGSV